MTLFGTPADKGYEALVAENSFITDVQLCIEEALDSRGISQAGFARLLGVSEARVSQLMSGNGHNLQARTIARLAHVLSMRPRIEFVQCEVCDVTLPELSKGASFTHDDLAHFFSEARDSRWGTAMAANDHETMLNEEEKLEVA